MKNILLAISCLLFINTIAQKNNDAAKFATTITQQDLKQQLSIIASAEMEGRETATEGQRKAAAYIEEQFKRLGLTPGNNNSYQQIFNVYQDELTSATLSLYKSSFAFNKHFTVSLNNTAQGSFQINEIIFASFGIDNKERNDYNNLDVKGKWVLLIESNPTDIDKGNTTSPSRNSSFLKIRTAMQKEVAGIIVISKSFDNKQPTTTSSMGLMYMKKPTETNQPIPIITVSYQAAASILTKTLNNYTDLQNIATGKYATNIFLTINKQTHTLQSSNVIGIIEGTDKKDEYVILTAHYDHLGKRGNDIYYGADDDGSGTVTIIEMAEAFAQAKKKGKGPRRTIICMTVSGEEKGLWGSDYYTQHPIYPLNKTTVNLNTDMIGRIDPSYKGDSLNYVYVIGEDKLSSDLLPISDSINQHFKLELDRRYNDPKDPNRFYYRSDHFNFAKNGVPVIFYFNGVHKDYHKPTDTIDKINFDVMEKRARFIFTTAWVMANRENMLKRDIPLNMPPRR
ncbi:MAG: M28 family peptidase [Chitinophagaceae bacterium]|nr:M28 family peptidase [Chitinophagaceae bacterium]MCW5904511.1 M28 family peptidase [Chitinophagaceae bacterium]